MFIVYFDYMFKIVSLSLCLCISSYSIHPNVHRVGGRDHVSVVLIYYLPMNTLYILGHVVDRGCDTHVDHVSVVLICYLPANTLYILSHVVDRGCDTPVESFAVHSPSIG
jgi:hypothetical protein